MTDSEKTSGSWPVYAQRSAASSGDGLVGVRPRAPDLA